MKRLLFVLLFLSVLSACNSYMQYDISEGINKEVTLFQDGITVPIGSIGPLTIGSSLNGNSKISGAVGLIANYLKVGPDGNMILEDTGSIFKISVYELEREAKDVSAPFKWSPGYAKGSPSGMAAALGLVGLMVTDQKIEISASNPLFNEVPVTCDASFTCYDSIYQLSYQGKIPALSSITLEGRSNNVKLASVELPPDIYDRVGSISLEGLTFSLPADPVSYLADRNGNLFFEFNYKHTCGVAVGEKFNLPLTDIKIDNVKLPLGQFRLSDCTIDVELENSLPLSVTIDNVRVLKHKDSEGEPDEVDENIKVSVSEIVPGGSLEHPASLPLTLSITAAEGTIPDIEGILLNISISAQPGLGPVRLAGKQGLYIKSSCATIKDGITIPQELSL